MNSDCPTGQYCGGNGICAFDCRSSNDCASDSVCTIDGQCAATDEGSCGCAVAERRRRAPLGAVVLGLLAVLGLRPRRARAGGRR